MAAQITVTLTDSNVVGQLTPGQIKFPLGASVSCQLSIRRGNALDELSGSSALAPFVCLGRIGKPMVTITDFTPAPGGWKFRLPITAADIAAWVATADSADLTLEVAFNDSEGNRYAEAIGKVTIQNVLAPFTGVPTPQTSTSGFSTGFSLGFA